MRGLHRAALAHALHALGAAPARAVQSQPMAASLDPAADGAGLGVVRVGAGHVGDEEPAYRQPFFDVREIVGDGGRNVPLGQQPQKPQAGVVVVVPGARAGRKTAGDEMGALSCRSCRAS